jgi:uncharacterized protein (TIGR03086 family)
MDILDQLDGAFTSTGRVVASMTPAQLGSPTPCTDWDVRALLDHATGVVAGFAATASRQPPGDARKIDWLATDPGTEFAQIAKETLAAWSEPGALDGTCRLSIGIEMPAQVAAGINFLDTLVHGWDLAKALGIDPALDPALATAALEVARMVVTDDFRGAAKGFGPAIALGIGASATDQLVAFLGRQP